jgi:predicted Rossmann fold nucleotide-binding protein DprA/Smf involved in DNA uptake
LVVAPAGWEVAYPEENRELFHQVVAEGGGYVSHLADDTTATRAAFFRRNELMAAVVQAVVLVEAPLRSGARNAVAAARRLGKQVFVVPSPPWSEPGRSAAVELLRGGTPLSGPKQLLRWLQRTAQLELVLDDAAGVERELTEALPVEPTPDVRAPVPKGRLPPRTDAELALLVARARQAAGAAGVALVQWLSLGDQTLAGAAAELGLPASRLSCLVTELELAGVLRRRTPEELELLGD